MTREEAKDILEWGRPLDGDSDGRINEFKEALGVAIEALEQETGWIPVGERLPEEREWMGTKRFGTTISDEVYVTFETPDGERFTKHLSFQNGGLSKTEQERMRVFFKGAVPIAWMPLPKPYEKEGEQE